MELRAFPVLYAKNVVRLAEFYESLGFVMHSQVPGPDGQIGFVALRRGGSEMAVTTEQSPEVLAGVPAGPGPRHEMFIYVHDLEASSGAAEQVGARVLRPPTTMPWGERIAYLQDSEGNFVTLAQADVL